MMIIYITISKFNKKIEKCLIYIKFKIIIILLLDFHYQKIISIIETALHKLPELNHLLGSLILKIVSIQKNLDYHKIDFVFN
jgi:hypothetical protein